MVGSDPPCCGLRVPGTLRPTCRHHGSFFGVGVLQIFAFHVLHFLTFLISKFRHFKKNQIVGLSALHLFAFFVLHFFIFSIPKFRDLEFIVIF